MPRGLLHSPGNRNKTAELQGLGVTFSGSEEHSTVNPGFVALQAKLDFRNIFSEV